MKKHILSILAIMLVLVTIVSCDGFNLGESGATKGLASVSFGESASKALSVSTDAAEKLVNSQYWWYRATKTDGGPDQGATSGWTRVNNSTGLDGVLTGFSVGEWSFDFYKQSDNTLPKETPSATVSGITVTLAAGKINYIRVNIDLEYDGGTATLIFKDITVPAATAGGTCTWSYSLDGGENYTDFSTGESGEYKDEKINMTLSNPSGSYDVVIKGVYTNTNTGKTTVRKGEITVRLYDEITTTISGSIDDLKTAVEFVGKVYQLSYDANIVDGSAYTGTLPAASMEGGNAIVSSGISREGLTFFGWNTKADGTGDTYQPGDTILIKADTTLYAMWYRYTVTFDLNGATGTAPEPIQSLQNNSVTLATAEATKARTDNNNNTRGYAFAGWNTEADGTGTFYAPGSSYTPAEDITLYAVWQGWVQLWEDGPKYAEFNVGSTISDYATVTTEVTDANKASVYSTANVGGLYTRGGTQDARVEYINDSNKGEAKLTGDTDTATKLWGSNWRMPTSDELEELIPYNGDGGSTRFDLVTWKWCDGVAHAAENDGHMQYVDGCTLAGAMISGKAGSAYANNSIFLPAAGWGEGIPFKEVGDKVECWSSVFSDTSEYFLCLAFGNNTMCLIMNPANIVESVRAVLAE